MSDLVARFIGIAMQLLWLLALFIWYHVGCPLLATLAGATLQKSAKPRDQQVPHRSPMIGRPTTTNCG